MLLDCGAVRLLRVPWTARRSNQSILKEILNTLNINISWIFIGRTDAEATILRRHDAKSWLIGKDLDAGKDWRQEEEGPTEDEMVGWYHWLDWHEFEQALEVGDAIQPSHPVVPFSCCLNLSQHQGLFQCVEKTFPSGGQGIGVLALAFSFSTDFL